MTVQSTELQMPSPAYELGLSLDVCGIISASRICSAIFVMILVPWQTCSTATHDEGSSRGSSAVGETREDEEENGGKEELGFKIVQWPPIVGGQGDGGLVLKRVAAIEAKANCRTRQEPK